MLSLRAAALGFEQARLDLLESFRALREKAAEELDGVGVALHALAQED